MGAVPKSDPGDLIQASFGQFLSASSHDSSGDLGAFLPQTGHGSLDHGGVVLAINHDDVPDG
jgi:hypothetical protein